MKQRSKTTYLRFDISVHNTVGMSIVESFQKLVHVVAAIIVREISIESFIVGVIDELEDEAWCFCMRIADNIYELDDVWATIKVL